EVVYFSIAGPICSFQTSRVFTLSRPDWSLFFETKSFKASLNFKFSLFLFIAIFDNWGVSIVMIYISTFVFKFYLVFFSIYYTLLPAIKRCGVINIQLSILDPGFYFFRIFSYQK